MKNESLNIFSIKAVSFHQGERDPFGFDDYSEKLGSEYLPFSGSVSKPAYFLFVSYVNHFLATNKSLWKNEKQKREIQIRLEKLLVYSWKKQFTKLELKGGVIGNSFNIKYIDVFSSKGWVMQPAFSTYNTSSHKDFCPDTLKEYLKKIGGKQVPILSDFILYENKEPQERAKYLEILLKQLKKKYSLFSHHQLDKVLKNKFRNELIAKINGKKDDDYFKLLEPYLKGQNDLDSFLKTLLEIKNQKIPFAFLNDWFEKFVRAVDADINDKANRKTLWIEADKSFDKIPKQLHSLSKTHVLQKRVKKRKWFQYNEKESQYTYYDKGSKSEKERIENLWESYKKRAGEKNEAAENTTVKYFFNYRHYALLRLLKELQ